MQSLAAYWSDLRTFGIGALWQEAGRLRKDSTVALNLRDVGRVRIRSRDSDMSCLRQVFADQQYRLGGPFEQRTRAAYDNILAEGSVPVIVDAGANIGAAALWFARTYPQATIVAVEPESENFNLLKDNVAGCANVVPVQAALGGTSGFVSVEKPDHCSAGCRTQPAEHGIRMLTVAECASLVENGRLFIVKIDIEGAEKHVFEHDTSWIDDVQAIIVEPHDWMLPRAGTSQPFLKELSRHDFDLLIMHENLGFVR